jgi:hypothetical protein
VDSGLSDGSDAWGQILRATTLNDPQYANLDTRFESNESRIANNTTDLTTLQGQIEQARVRTNAAGVVIDTFNTITDRLNNTDNTVSLHRGYIETL